MTAVDKKIGFIGAGNMAEAMLGAMTGAGTVLSSNVIASDISGDRLEFLNKKYGINISNDNSEIFEKSDIIILAVKPQLMESVVQDLVSSVNLGSGSRKLIISIAAGVPISKFEAWFYNGLDSEGIKNLPIVRVMPNTPSLVLEGMSGFSANINATQEDKDQTKTILSSMGKAEEFTEEMLHGVTAVSGSGPAYVFLFIEAMVKAGKELGLEESEASLLTIQTFKGAIKLLESMDDTPEDLRKKVTSPGGTTEAAINSMQQNEIETIIKNGMVAALERSKELSK